MRICQVFSHTSLSLLNFCKNTQWLSLKLEFLAEKWHLRNSLNLFHIIATNKSKTKKVTREHQTSPKWLIYSSLSFLITTWIWNSVYLTGHAIILRWRVPINLIKVFVASELWFFTNYFFFFYFCWNFKLFVATSLNG